MFGTVVAYVYQFYVGKKPSKMLMMVAFVPEMFINFTKEKAPKMFMMFTMVVACVPEMFTVSPTV